MKISYPFYLFTLILAPLAFGAVELWSMATVEVLTGIAAIFLFSAVYFYRRKLYFIPGLTPLLLLLFFMLVQLVPLPADFIRLISPSAHSAYAPVLAIAGNDWIPLTINQKATLQEFFRISCYSLFYILTIQLLSIDGRLKKTLFTVIGLAAGIALLAIIQQFDSPDKIYWFRAVPENASPFGPWINPNQFAGYMEMMSPLALGLFLFYRPRVRLDLTPRERFVNFFTMPGSNLHLFLGSAATLMVLSVFVSLCRGGILTIIISVFVFMLLYNMKKPKHGRAALLVIVGCVIITVSWFGWGTVIAELQHGFSSSGELSDGRFLIWADSLRIIQSFFLFGSGFGTYIDIFPSFRSFPGYHIFDHAHNDYLELLTDGGIIGFSLAGWFVLAVLRHGWRMLRKRNDQYAVLLGIGALTGIVAMLMHSMTDFNMHNGANGLYFFFLCGLLIAVVNSRFGYTESMTLLNKQRRYRNIIYLSGAVVLTILTTIVQSGALLAQAEYNRVKDIYVNRHLSEPRLQALIYGVSLAKRFDPWEDRYSYKFGTIEWVFENREKSLGHFLQAARQNPMNGAALQRIGLLIGEDDETKAKMLLEKGYQRNLNNEELAISFAEYLLHKGERDEAVELVATRLQKTPALIKKWAPLLEAFSFSREEISTVLLRSVDAWMVYGEYLEKMNNIEEADYYFSTALSFIESEEQIKPHWFHKLIQFYKKNDQPAKALLILRQAAELVPDHASFHIQLGDYYRVEGITYRAREEYQRALMIDPGNKTVIKRLRQMGLSDSY